MNMGKNKNKLGQHDHYKQYKKIYCYFKYTKYMLYNYTLFTLCIINKLILNINTNNYKFNNKLIQDNINVINVNKI